MMITPILTLIGGFALFLYGMDLVSEGLKKFSAQKMRAILNLMTHNRFLALLLGALTTVTLQSSSAISVMLISFVNSSLMKLDQALALLLGANIGTTLTVQILAFDIGPIALLGIALGFFIMKTLRREIGRYLGLGLIGLGLIFYGINILKDALGPLVETNLAITALHWVRNSYLLSFLAGIVFTAIIHASTAVIVLIMALVAQGTLGLNDSLPLILGANVGTCMTALVASLGRGPNAWRLAIGNLSMKLIGAALFFPILPWFSHFVQDLTLMSTGEIEGARFVANAHTFFNIAVSLILLPLTRLASSLLHRIIPEALSREPLDLARGGIEAVQKGVREMGERIGQMLSDFTIVLKDNNLKTLRKMVNADEEVDLLNSQLMRFLTQEAKGRLGTQSTRRETMFLYGIDLLEHIGDVLSKDLALLARKKISRDVEFSIEGQAEVEEFCEMVYNLYTKAFLSFITEDKGLADEVVQLSEQIRKSKRTLYLSHLIRVKKGIQETMQTGSIHRDLISALDRICDCSTHFAKAILE